MASFSFQIGEYLKYFLHKVNDHSLQSPFIFDFYQQIVKNPVAIRDEIEVLRKSLKASKELIPWEEIGAGSRISNSDFRKVSEIAKSSSTPSDFSRVLAQMIRHFEFKTVVELGTSLGLNSAYLAHEVERLITFEGNRNVLTHAEANFAKLNLSTKVETVFGDLDETFQSHVATWDTIDLLYLDANHRYEPTVRYFKTALEKKHSGSIFVFDDIHWSKGMRKAWDEIIAHPEVTLSIDLFEAGFVFFDPNLEKKSYTLNFR